MYFEQFYLGCLSHASYMLASGGHAVVVDPQRDVDLYLEAAARQGLKIGHIFETHLHADFVSGHRELAERTGARIYIGAEAGATFPHVPVNDGFELRVGKMLIRALGTPGHTPESICLIVTDEEKSLKPWAVLTGDTLFIGDVGRPDLSTRHTPAQLAGLLYDSLHKKLMKLDDEVLVYPAHGAGSLCGRNLRAEKSSTIGTERLTNYALQIKSKEDFVVQMTANLPARPEFFQQDAEINRSGAQSLSCLPIPRAIRPYELKSMMEAGTIVLDVRTNNEFAEGHVPGSINIALSGQFATWAGSLLGLSSQPMLIADTVERISEARVRLARVGMENLSGFLEGGVTAWRNSGLPVAMVKQITVETLRSEMDSGRVQVLDVRREGEWDAGHIDGAQWWPLDYFKVSPPELDSAGTTAVHCKSGYRSMIACSLLLRAGSTSVVNVIGGLDAWQQDELSVVRKKAVGV
jgi:hydroxyacylglutathione hydrolase